MRMFFILLIAFALTEPVNCQAEFYATARIPTPVLNSPDFGKIFGGRDCSSLKTDHCGQVRELEYIALPGTAFKILDALKRGTTTIYQVETEEYPTNSTGIRLYVDSRFLELHSTAKPQRKRSLPERDQIIAALIMSLGIPYVWGGNVQQGIPELSHYFYRKISSSGKKRLTLAGLDCSGLLYQATGGWTPRNTSQLVSFGQPLPVKGKNVQEIARLLEPLDLIAWKGHVIIVLDRDTVIESRLECGKPGNGGVMTTSLQKRLTEVMQTRRPEDSWPTAGMPHNTFVIRRWCNR